MVSDEVKKTKAAIAAVLGRCRIIVRQRPHGTSCLDVFIPEAHYKDKETREKVAEAIVATTGRGVVGTRGSDGYAAPYYNLSWS
jgi:hypothetical protein